MENDFSVDTSKQVQRDFMKKIKRPLNIALLLTGLQSICAILYIVGGVANSAWNDMGVANFVMGFANYLPIVCIFASLIMLVASEKPFTNTLTVCMRVIAALFLLESVVFPRLPGYQISFEILSVGEFTLLDGNRLTLGVVLYILSLIIREGFAMQKESEEIL